MERRAKAVHTADQPALDTRHLLELLESRQLMSAGGGEAGVDVALIDSTLPDHQALGAAAQGKVITFDGRRDSAARVLGRLVTWAGTTGNTIRSISILSHGAEGRFRLGNEW